MNSTSFGSENSGTQVGTNHGSVTQIYISSGEKYNWRNGDFDGIRNGQPPSIVRDGPTPTPKLTWRVRGVPLDFDEKKLENFLQHHPGLQIVAAANEADERKRHNTVRVHTLARDVRHGQIATVRFLSVPTQLERKDELLVVSPVNIPENVERRSSSHHVPRLSIDQHFRDVTVLFAPLPGEHEFDILAVPGLGGHAFSSFVSKTDRHMWLSDTLPGDIPTARVMTCGYDSRLLYSTSFATLDDLAQTLRIAICRVVRSERKHLILIGHSLGGLLIKEALIKLADSNSDSDVLGLVVGALFFGVPNDGMDIESLLPMVTNQPNQILLGTLHNANSQILALQRRSFSALLKRANFELYCFYETQLSPTAAKDESGQYRMDGPDKCLVTRNSATSCLPLDISSDHSVPIHRTHSELVKFSAHDADFDAVFDILHQIILRFRHRPQILITHVAHDAISDPHSNQPNAPPHWVVPFRRNKDFVGRKLVLGLLLKTIPPHANVDDCQRTAIEGLGGIGKTQIALEAAFRVRSECPHCSIFWVPATEAASFENAYRQIGRRLKLQLIDNANTDVKMLVKEALSRASGSWLLIIDNADDLDLLFGNNGHTPLTEYLPSSPNGSILFTTRTHEVVRRLKVRQANVVHVAAMRPNEAIELLQTSLDTRETGDSDSMTEFLGVLAHLPLAIKQAASTISRLGWTTAIYLDYFRSGDKQLCKLLSEDFEDQARYEGIPHSVATTWRISFRRISREKPLAAQYLQFMSVLAEKDILKALLPPGNSELEEDEAISLLKGYAFISEQADRGSYDMHTLVRLAMRIWLRQEAGLKACVAAVIQRLDAVYPFPRHEKWDLWKRYLPHALTALELRDHSIDAATSRLLYKVAENRLMLGKYRESKQIHLQTLEVQIKAFGKKHPHTLRTKCGIADALYHEGQHKAAEGIYRQMLELQTEVLDEQHPDILQTKSGLAIALARQGQHKAAEAMYRQTLELRTRVLGAEHPDTLSSMYGLAIALDLQGQHKTAEAMYRQTLELRTKVLGAEHPDTLSSMYRLAFVLDHQGQHKTAEAMYRQTLELRTKVLGAEHPDTLSSMNTLANTRSRSHFLTTLFRKKP